MIEPRHVQPAKLNIADGRWTYTYRFAVGEGLLPHTHPYPHEIAVVSGDVTVQLGDQLRVLRAGERLTYPTDSIHGCVALTPCECLQIFSADDLARFEPNLPRSLQEVA